MKSIQRGCQLPRFILAPLEHSAKRNVTAFPIRCPMFRLYSLAFANSIKAIPASIGFFLISSSV